MHTSSTTGPTGEITRQYGIDPPSSMIPLYRQQLPKGSTKVVDMLAFHPTTAPDGSIANLSLFMLNREELPAMPLQEV